MKKKKDDDIEKQVREELRRVESQKESDIASREMDDAIGVKIEQLKEKGIAINYEVIESIVDECYDEINTRYDNYNADLHVFLVRSLRRMGYFVELEQKINWYENYTQEEIGDALEKINEELEPKEKISGLAGLVAREELLKLAKKKMKKEPIVCAE